MKNIEITHDLNIQLPIRVTETKKGHEYFIANRHTDGEQIVNFAEFKTYKQMIDSGMDQELIKKIVPENHRDCNDCAYYLVSPGAFSQDYIEMLIRRVEFQYKWFKNGFYAECIKSLKNALIQYELFTIIRIEFGFYHVPFSIENMVKSIMDKSMDDLEKNRKILNTFFEFDLSQSDWQTKEELVSLIKQK